jgi:type IV pilus assembly protein PilQ
MMLKRTRYAVAAAAMMCAPWAYGETPVGPVAATTAPARPLAAGRTTAGSGGITNVFVDTDLRQALQDVASQGGVTIIPEQTVSGIVSADLKNVPVEKALEILLAGTGYGVKKTPDYYLVYSSDAKSPSFRQTSETRLVKLDYAAADAALKLISPVFKDYVQADVASGALIITAPPTLADRIQADLKLIDRPVKHIMLQARIVALENTDTLNLGTQWNFPQMEAGLFTSSDQFLSGAIGPKVPWGVQVGYAPDKTYTNSLMLTLNLMGQNNDLSIVASPELTAQDAKEAEIKVTTDEYFQISAVSGLYVQSQLEKIESGTILHILPRIGDNDEITLEMNVEVSDVAARAATGLPVVSRRTTKSTLHLKSGGTAAVAGLQDTRSTVARQSVPGASDLPGVGRAFDNDDNSRTSKQLAIFITATVLEDGNGNKPQPQVSRAPLKPVDVAAFRKELQESLRRINGGGTP